MNNYIIPDNFNDLIISNKDDIINFYNKCLKKNNFNILISGSSGTCKTTLINIIINNFFKNKKISMENNLLKLSYYDDINLQSENNEISIFCQTNTNSEKIVYIDNFDQYGESSQQAIKILIDKYFLIKKKNKVFFILESNNINKIKDIIQTRMNICEISDFSQDILTIFFIKCLHHENINYDEDAIKYITSKGYINTYTLTSIIPKIKLLDIEKITVENIKEMCDIIDIHIFSKYFDLIEKNEMDNAVKVLYELYDYGYDIGDIYFYIFEYIKKNKIEKYYNICEIICLYISEMYNGNYNKIMLIIFTYDIKNVIYNKIYY